MMNEWAKVKGLDWGAAADAHDRRQAGRVGQLAQLRRHHPGARRTRTSSQASKVFISYISEKLDRVGQVRPDPGPQHGPGERPSSQALEVQSTLAEQLDYVMFPPAVPGIGDVTAPTFETGGQRGRARQEADPRRPWTPPPKKADALLAANRKKYGA